MLTSDLNKSIQDIGEDCEVILYSMEQHGILFEPAKNIIEMVRVVTDQNSFKDIGFNYPHNCMYVSMKEYKRDKPYYNSIGQTDRVLVISV